jgi:polyhydroxyalkanoate depolymerase
MLPDHDVYLTDWHNARDVPVSHGPFGLDDFIAQLIDFLWQLCQDVHVVAVCHPTVATLVAVALMDGPNDTRVQPTRVNELAVTTPLAWFEQHLIDVVPQRFAGARRRVYPGFVQVAAFLSMHPARHAGSLMDCYQYLVQGETAKAEAIRAFYADYFATMERAGRVLSGYSEQGLPAARVGARATGGTWPPRGSAGHPAHGAADH